VVEQRHGAELHLELWGGHPGSANKRVPLNGRSTYALPRVGTEDEHCTCSYPSIPKEYFKLNGVHYPVADGAGHELRYSRLPVNPRTLRRGSNLVELLSDGEHHGIEVLLPGPALVIRSAAE
jgi:hypothetical protein